MLMSANLEPVDNENKPITTDSVAAEFALTCEAEAAILCLRGDWQLESVFPAFSSLRQELQHHQPTSLGFDFEQLGHWDSSLTSFLYQLQLFCEETGITVDQANVPDSIIKLRDLATAVPLHKRPEEKAQTPWERFNPQRQFREIYQHTETSLSFTGEVGVALMRFVTGRANTRRVDFINFIYQAGPNALGIIALTSFLVGMILAYLGAAQLAQFGAEIYVADLVAVGMLREMGALMAAVVMAGRTGAAYAAQLGTMQTNDEIDAIITLGISPIEFLVLPRMLALIVIMPLLVLYANVIGMIGGAIVAAGMGVSLTQFFVQVQSVFTPTLLGIGIIKSVAFATLIALAGCRAGIQCGRSSAAVGQATTEAVVRSIVYLIIADAAFNILFQKLGI